MQVTIERRDIRAGIVGATGYAGVELVRLLLGHPSALITKLSSDSQSGHQLGSVFPHLTGPELPELGPFDAADFASQCDLVFLARGNGWAMKHAGELLEKGCKVVDLAADFRLKDTDIWKHYYGMEHDARELLSESVYGLPELHASKITQARLVANPGCYSTCAILALAPAVAGQWVEYGNICIASASGTSGAGRSRTETAYLFSEINENYRAYNVGGHRHTGEIDQELSELSGEQISVTFTPHLAPMTRGIHTTAYARLADGVDQAAIRDAYVDFYRSAAFVTVCEPGELPQTKQALASNRCFVSPIVSERSGMLVVTAVIDNLVKGAAGQAIQNMNLMMSIDETAGLSSPGVYP